jgi:hypothetical protein
MAANKQPSDTNRKLAPQEEIMMKTITKFIPVGTKVYATLANCCRYQNVRPGGAQPVFDAASKKSLGFAVLPEKLDGSYVYWTK